MKKFLVAGFIGSLVTLTSCGGGGSDGGSGFSVPSVGSGGSNSFGGNLPSSITLTEYNVSPQQLDVGSTVKLSWKVSPSDVFSYTLEVFESSTANLPTGTTGIYKIFSVNCGSGMGNYTNCTSSGTATCEITDEYGSVTVVCYPDVQNPYKQQKALINQGNGFLIFRACATSSNLTTVCDTKSVPVQFPTQQDTTKQSFDTELQQQPAQ